MRFSGKTIRLAVILYIALLIPVTVFHELGHGLVCASTGNSYRIWIDFTGGHEQCSSAPTMLLFSYSVMGGIFGLIASGAIMLAGVAAKRHPAVLAVGLAFAVDQVMKVVLEGFFTRSYLFHRFDALITAVQIVSWIGFMLYFARVPEHPRISAGKSVQ